MPLMDVPAKRNLVERIADQATFAQAYADLREHLSNRREVTNFHFGYKVLSTLPSDIQHQAFHQQLKLALLTSYTNDFLIPLLQTDLMLEGLACEVYTPHYNQFRQEILNASSGFYAFRPDVTIVAFELDDMFPDSFANFARLTTLERDEFSRQIQSLYESLAQSFHENMAASGRSCLFLQNQGHPFQAYDPLTVTNESLSTFVRRINRDLERLPKKFPNVYLLDYAKLIDQYGRQHWSDPRLYYSARIPVAQNNWLNLSDAYVRYIKAALNLDIKCIVLDLDNTLWGGILGEDGIDNIQLGESYPGSVFRKFQQYLLSLHADGYILAIASKNNWDDVSDVLRSHRSMVLKQEHFAAMKVNWREKADNIRELSEEIGISVDHMLFVDDNPVELCKVKSALPAINCVQLGTPPLNFPTQLGRLRCFAKLAITEEDKRRGEMYLRDRQRRDLRQNASSLDDFYRSLGQRLMIHVNSKKHLSRIVQLTQRTNQFNMTTTRLTERAAEELLSRPDYLLITAELTDRFGDNGVVAYAQIRRLDRAWCIDNLVMSCRVLGRMVEETLLDHLIQMAKCEGVDSVEASFVMTRKNAPFADFYIRNGFTQIENGAKNGSVRTKYTIDVPAHIGRNLTMEITEARNDC
jgi:FkbH-like protein